MSSQMPLTTFFTEKHLYLFTEYELCEDFNDLNNFGELNILAIARVTVQFKL